MTRWPVVAAVAAVVALAGWAYVEANPTGVAAPASLSSTESAAATTPKDAPPAEKKADETKKAEDAAEAYKARQEAARQLKEYARTRRTVMSPMRSKPGLNFERTAVKEVLNYMAEVGRFSIVYDEALEQAGIDLSARLIDIRVQGVTYEKAIELILPRECGYRVGPGYVLVTTLEKSWMPLQTLAYSIRLALAQVPNFTGAPRFEVSDVIQAASQAAAGGGIGDLFGGGKAAEPDDSQATPEKIIEMIQKFVNNQSDRRVAPWADEGGPATIEYLSGQLIISQTEHGHRAIRRLIAMIE